MADSQMTTLPPCSGPPGVLARDEIASSSKSHSASVSAVVEGTAMSTAPLAMLVMDGVVASLRLSTVG